MIFSRNMLYPLNMQKKKQPATHKNHGEQYEKERSQTIKITQTNRDHLTLFSNRSQPKKKRKSRTAFTNHQIFELEKRFLYQKYLSPADRDEIAQSLGLTNAQVITWFQNRRAKLKRDMEELKKDVDASKIILHKNIMSNIQDLSLLKGKDVGLLTKDVALQLAAASRTAD